MRRPNGFTLVELLVVIAVIAILMSLTVPQIGAAIGKARDTGCKVNMSQILKAGSVFTADNNKLMPSAWSRGSDSTNEWQMCFVGKEIKPDNVTLSSDWPRNKFGSLAAYIGGGSAGRRLYRCPGLKPGVLRSGKGSNGYFDYVMFEVFAGVKQTRMPSRARVNFGAGMEDVPCPWLTEEDPAEYLNAGFMQPFHLNTDRMGTWHNRRANVGTADGAVITFEAKARTGGVWKNPRALDWRARTPSGREESLYSTEVRTVDGWGWWNNQ